MKKWFAVLTSLLLLLSLTPALATAPAAPEPGTAYIMYADAAWTVDHQYWMDGKEWPVTAENVVVTEPGDYKVSLTFPGDPSLGLAFMALGIRDGEALFPGMAFTVKEVKVNGEPVALVQTYTSSDDEVETRTNIYNEWVGELPVDARIASGSIADSTPKAVDPAAFASVQTVEVSFTMEPATVTNAPAAPAPVPTEATAYVMYADEAWAAQYWLDGNEWPVTAQNATVTGEGVYEVSLAFPEDAKAKGLAFTALGIKDGELAFPGFIYQLDAILVNGAEIPFTKGYTSSDDGAESRVNIFNAWVGELPADARTPDGSLEGAAPIIVDPALFAEVGEVRIRFTAISPKAEAYIMYADSGWTDDHQYWLDGTERATKGTNAWVKGEGSYEASLQFPEGSPAQGAAFIALGIKDGEKIFPNYIYQIDEILVNGEPVAFTPGYTSSDDMIETRTNIFNEWVSELPPDARVAEGEVSGASPKMVEPAAFASVQTLTVRFTAIKGEAPAAVVESKINPDGYPAFLMFADDGWLWENMKTGTAGDTVVMGDGVYEVFISKDTLPAEMTALPANNAQVLCVDITDLGAAMEEIGTVFASTEADPQLEVAIAVFVDGERLNVRNDRLIYGDIEGNNKLRIEIFNTYGTGTMDNPPVDPAAFVQQQELRVVFSLKGTGFNTEAEADLEAWLAAK